MKDLSNWNEEVANETARREGLAHLDPMHREIVRFLREHYEEYDCLPTRRRACKISGDWKDSCLSCFFRDNPVKAVKIAGIPEPGEDLEVYCHGVCKCDRPSSAVLEKEL